MMILFSIDYWFIDPEAKCILLAVKAGGKSCLPMNLFQMQVLHKLFVQIIGPMAMGSGCP